MNGAQLVALRNSSDGSQPQLVALQVDENTIASSNANTPASSVDGLQLNNPVVVNTGTGYQSVAIMASGEGGQSGEVNYVLIVNQNSENKDNVQTPMYDFGDDYKGEVVQELLDDNGSVKRLVKINQILGKRSTENIHAIPVGDQLMCSFCNYTSHKRLVPYIFAFLFNSLPHNLDFQQSQDRSLLKTLWEKEKMLVTSIFSFSHNVFYPIKDRNHHLSYIYFIVCKCFEFDDVHNFVIW